MDGNMDNEVIINNEIDSTYVEACITSDFEKLKDFLSSITFLNHINLAFYYACKNARIDLLNYLLSFDCTSNYIKTQSNDQNGFFVACEDGQLSVIEYLLTHHRYCDELNINKEYFQTILNEALLIACKKGRTKVVKFLLSSSKIERHADIHYQDDKALIIASQFKNFLVVKFLLTGKQLKRKANIHAYNDAVFTVAYKHGHMEIVRFLLLELQMPISESMLKIKQEFFYPEGEKMFKERTLSNKDSVSIEINSNQILTTS